MAKRTRIALYSLFALANLMIAGSKAMASDLVHTAAYDPSSGRWIVVCVQCFISCNCTEKPAET